MMKNICHHAGLARDRDIIRAPALARAHGKKAWGWRHWKPAEGWRQPEDLIAESASLMAGGFVSHGCCLSADPLWAPLLSRPNPDSRLPGLDNSRCSHWAGPLTLPRDAGHQPTADMPPSSGQGSSCGTGTVSATTQQRAASLKSERWGEPISCKGSQVQQYSKIVNRRPGSDVKFLFPPVFKI